MSETTALATTRVVKLEDLEAQWFREKLIRAIPNTMKAERMVQLALTMIKGSPSLLRCTPISLMSCVVECAQLGLELDKVLGHAYLVPFKGTATLIVGYRGFAHLMYQSGVVHAISAEVVRPKDVFKRTLGTRRELIHEPAPIPKKDDPDTWLGAYAVAEMITGKTEFEYLEAVKIEQARARSQSWRAWLADKKESPWHTDAEEMWRKTAIRRLAKRMPVSTTDKREALLRACILDEYGERRLLTPTVDGFTVSDDAEPVEATTEQPDLTEQLEKSVAEVNKKKASKPPKAKIPPDKVAEVWEKKTAAELMLDSKQQTEIYHAAFQAGFKVPEGLNEMLQKRFHVPSLKHVKSAQFAELLRAVEAGGK